MPTHQDLENDHFLILSKIEKLRGELEAFQVRGNQNLTNTLTTVNGNLTTFIREYKEGIEKDKEQTPAGAVKAVAAGTPGTTTAILAAVTVYSRDPVNPIAGTAAALDIVTGLATMVSGLAGMAGPLGAAVSALTSMVSMILGFFAPKPDDLVTQIEKVLRTINAEEKDISIRAAADGVRVYANASNRFMTRDAERKKLIDPDPATLAEQLSKVNLIEGNIIMNIRNVEHWLEKGGNQELDAWSEIFRLLCDTYFQLSCTVTEQYSYAYNTNYMTQYFGDNDSGYKKRVKNWESLQIQAKAKKANLDENNKLVITFLNQALPIARKRGVYVVGWEGGSIYTGTGPSAFRQPKFKDIWAKSARMSITPPREGVTGPDARYDAWVINSGDNDLLRHHLSIQQLRFYGDSQIVERGAHDKFNDVWPDPTARADGTFTIYAVAPQSRLIDKRDTSKKGAVQRYGWDGKNTGLKQEAWELRADQKMSQIRLVRPQSFEDVKNIPEEFTKIPDDFAEKLSKGASLIYATLDGSREIFVAFTDATSNDHQWRVKLYAQSYNGIAVDPHFLWVYGHEGFQCATHAAVLSSLKTGATPRWLGQGHPNGVGDVLDLSPCEDGTLLLSCPSFCAQTQYRIDFAEAVKGGRDGLVMNDKWENLDLVLDPRQVQKLPLYCWPEVKSLMKGIGMQA